MLDIAGLTAEEGKLRHGAFDLPFEITKSVAKLLVSESALTFCLALSLKTNLCPANSCLFCHIRLHFLEKNQTLGSSVFEGL